MSDKLKILYWDIETSHDVVATFQMYNTTITPDRHLKHWFMICASWQWEGEKAIQSVSVLDNKKRFKQDFADDFHVVQTMHKVLDTADALVGHNVIKFDLRKFNARAIYHGLKPIKPLIMVDTLKMARKYFQFVFNRLGTLAEYLGLGSKIKTDSDLWLGCLRGDKASINRMVKYNKQDVKILRLVYKKLAPYCTTALNYSVVDSDVLHCPSCGATHMYKDGWRYTQNRRYQGYKCMECGSRPKSTKADPMYRALIK
jgi:predicted RNA-binding Zn-ribbon protein involved in translation (DUF1610 family)